MAIMQLNSKVRWLVVVLFFASLLIAAVLQNAVSKVLVGLSAVAMLTIPCGQRFINRNRWAWVGRQLYFVALAVAWLVSALYR